ncbi:MAG: REP element-mobilizing transposase RayT [Gammaproteobacteria bacterium]|jgi:REP element-mobilizing transposase RayT
MTKARSSLVSVSDTPYYHCISRCVRRAYLCGDDDYTGQSYEHRRAWFIERLATLAEVFSIEVAAYAVMSNHCHLVVHIDEEAARRLSVDEVIERWCTLYRGPHVIQRYRAGGALSVAEHEAVSTVVETWRGRLSNLSWFMRCLNEHIARRANAEDGCTGRFWEGRFKSQALLDKTALITAMAYVDLNPIRAGIANDVAGSDKTSIQQRLKTITGQPLEPQVPLQNFSGVETQVRFGLPFNGQDYLDLVDWTGRCIRDDKRRAIDPRTPKLLAVLGIAEGEWLPNVTTMQARYEVVMGAPEKMKAHALSRGGRFYRGYRHALRLYPHLAA